MGFLSFRQLPPELRLQIWDESLTDEIRMRRGVVLDEQMQVMPIIQLFSPLLFVNKESREAAIRQYSTTLDIFRVAAFDYAAHLCRVSPFGCESLQSFLSRLHFLFEDAEKEYRRHIIPEAGEWIGVVRDTSEYDTLLGKTSVNHFDPLRVSPHKITRSFSLCTSDRPMMRKRLQ